ncbi:hypothetical protein GCM10009556_063560 [Acrocarpospora pleiomorpha]
MLDGAEPGVGLHRLRIHLDRCPVCVDWLSGAAGLGRALRAMPAAPAPDLTDRIMRGLTGPPPKPAWPLRLARTLAGAIAVCQIVIGYAMVVAPSLVLHEGGASHELKEIGAFNLAIGVGFLTAALRPRSVWGVLPAATAGAMILTGTALWDLGNAQVVTLREAHHLFVVAGWMALLWLAVLMRNPPDTGQARGGGFPATSGGGGAAASPGATA